MKPGPKPKSPDGHPKARYHTRMATDLIAFLRTLPNAAEWLDGVIRAAMPSGASVQPCCESGTCVTLADLATRLWIPWCRSSYAWLIRCGHLHPGNSEEMKATKSEREYYDALELERASQ